MTADSLPAPALARPCTEPPYRGRVLVVAPHPDDESFGPGGVLAMHARLGDPVHVAFVTTGVHGDETGARDPEQYMTLRREEAARACAALGVQTTEFWGFPDGCEVTPADLEAVTAHVVDLLERVRPDVVYAPHTGESHADHHFVALAVERARASSGSSTRQLAFEVWTPLVPDFVVDVSGDYAAKRAAMGSYPSQVEAIDLVGAIDALNRYRTILLPATGQDAERRAEAFREVPVKVVHVVHQYPPEFRGGTEACVQMLTAAQRRRGEEPFVVAGTGERSETGELRLEAVDHVPVCRVLRRPGENYSMDHRLPRVAEQVVELIGNERPDVVHLHHTLNLSGDLGARLASAGWPVVATLHDFTLVCARWFLSRPDGASCAESFPLPSERCVACVLPDFPAGVEALERETRARAETARAEAEAIRVAIAPSACVAERWRRSGLFDPGRLVVLPHPTGLGAGAPVRPRDRRDGRLVLATWGHLAPAKGVLDLLAAMRRVGDPRLALVALGDPVDADHAEQLLDAAEGLDVTFGGRYESADLHELAARVDLAVFPSRAEETFGLVVAEARALGLPVVVSDRGALQEGVGGAGAVVPAADPGALAAVLANVLADADQLATWRRGERPSHLDPAAHAAAVRDLYDRALQR